MFLVDIRAACLSFLARRIDLGSTLSECGRGSTKYPNGDISIDLHDFHGNVGIQRLDRVTYMTSYPNIQET